MDDVNSRNYDNTVYWVEVERIKPNPFQPRKEFNLKSLGELAESIRQYGVLQPLVVTKHEIDKEDGGIGVEYELIAGERRLRAAGLAGVRAVPVVIRSGEETDKMKLELAIIENVQREDLNPVDRALAFKSLIDKFKYTHQVVAKKIGKSRFYVTNTLRILALPEHMREGVLKGELSEGHTRPLLMLSDKPEEQEVLYKDIVIRKLSVRESETSARKIATERSRGKRFDTTPEVIEIEQKLAERLGTRVEIQKKEKGGRVVINFFSTEELQGILEKMSEEGGGAVLTGALGKVEEAESSSGDTTLESDGSEEEQQRLEANDEPDLYSVTNFTV